MLHLRATNTLGQFLDTLNSLLIPGPFPPELAGYMPQLIIIGGGGGGTNPPVYPHSHTHYTICCTAASSEICATSSPNNQFHACIQKLRADELRLAKFIRTSQSQNYIISHAASNDICTICTNNTKRRVFWEGEVVQILGSDEFGRPKSRHIDNFLPFTLFLNKSRQGRGLRNRS